MTRLVNSRQTWSKNPLYKAHLCIPLDLDLCEEYRAYPFSNEERGFRMILSYKSHVDKAGTELKSKFFQVQTQDIFH